MDNIITFEFKGKTYKQDPNKVEQQKREVGYIGAKFCSKCPPDIQCACHDWFPEEDGTIWGNDYKELKKVKPHACMEYGRPEEM